MRHTIRGIILKDRRILLVTGHGADFYWTPGGGVEGNETPIQTLQRELKEELGVTIMDHSPYHSYEDNDQKVDNFIVTVQGALAVGEEITGYAWFSSQSGVKTSNGFSTMLLPKLLEDGLIT